MFTKIFTKAVWTLFVAAVLFGYTNIVLEFAGVIV
jgi:hypothetical protein